MEPEDRDGDDLERLVRPAAAPPHLFRPNACYFITAKTLHGQPLITDPRKQEVIEALSFACGTRGWQMPAWVILGNHYHCMLQAPEQASSLASLLKSVHQFTALAWNREDAQIGRQVWYRYWDTCLDRERSFWARLNYIHHNPAKHGLVQDPADYPYSSYRKWCGQADIDYLESAYPWELLELE